MMRGSIVSRDSFLIVKGFPFSRESAEVFRVVLLLGPEK
jgi:hypothetical protein